MLEVSSSKLRYRCCYCTFGRQGMLLLPPLLLLLRCWQAGMHCVRCCYCHRCCCCGQKLFAY